MMQIQCTKKLLDELKVKPSAPLEEEPLYSWHANLLTVGRRKTVVLVNDSNRYVVVLYGVKTKDFKKIDELILHAIRETFRDEGIMDEAIEQLISQSKEISFTKTKNRTLVARMNKACETLYFYEDLLNTDSLYQSSLSKKISRLLVGDGKKSYIYPNKELYKDLEGLTGRPIFSLKAMELHVTLKLEKYKVWRRIVVPVNMTFSNLHKILQIVFDWKDYHLHEFYIYADKPTENVLSINHLAYHEEEYQPIVNLVCSEEAFNYADEIPMKLETHVKLSEYLPAKVKYNYDFGDDWQHVIEVEEVVEDYAVNYPICLDGEGNTPPEDVGGETGFEEFLEIIADKTHSEYEFMNTWGRRQGYQDFDIKMINLRLKSMW
ncbi:plasmid pRiA4b ORF-3 family protein [Bacillus solitudinis]|uniref:plasmid pRiA4b ORF-3 family protein n=1 Tax=Bacillus solitudinis TaxID=2014074 RepID=UPI001D0D09F5|nr:plasmid pRiA4b ORF-3 family protein [Bacillus solitudinis]